MGHVEGESRPTFAAMPAETKAVAAGQKKAKKVTKQPVRLYSRAVILGYKRSKANCYANTTLVKIEGVLTRQDSQFYCGKRVAYIYRAKAIKKGTNLRVMWGKITRPHGNSGTVRGKFRKNIPPRAFGARCRVMMYPSTV